MIEVDAADFTIGIIGSGAMGAGIAQVALAGGMRVVLWDASRAALEKAQAGIGQRLARLAEKGELTQDAASAATARLALAGELAEFAPCRVVIEAVVENLEVKRDLFKRLEDIVAADAILASNTSSLPIAAIAQPCRDRARVAGMHFFNPVPLMKLVEIIAAADTAPEVTDALARLGRRMTRVPVIVKDAPGFLVNLGGRAFTTEALHILEEGVAEPGDVDAVMRECCGFRMGPFELMDLTGIDVNYPASRIVHEGYMYDPRIKTTQRHAAMAAAGLLGRKTGRGWFAYDEGGRKRETPPAPVTTSALPPRIVLADTDDTLVALTMAAKVETIAHDDGASPILLAPIGEDCTTACVRRGVDHRRAVAIDLSHETRYRITMMTAPGADPAVADAVAAMLHAAGRVVTRIKDSPGFIAQRITAMIANLGCEIAQIGLATPADIDTAMRLGLNYPKGPLELADAMGPRVVLDIMERMQAITGSDRYRPSLWLRRRALLGMSAKEE